MAFDMIDTIKKAESLAVEIKKDAKEKAKQIIDKAYSDAKQNTALTEKAAYELADKIETDAKNEAELMIKKQNDAFAEKISKLSAESDEKLSYACDFILKELFAYDC